MTTDSSQRRFFRRRYVVVIGALALVAFAMIENAVFLFEYRAHREESLEAADKRLAFHVNLLEQELERIERAPYFVHSDPNLIGKFLADSADLGEDLERLAKRLDVQRIEIFDPDGALAATSHAKPTEAPPLPENVLRFDIQQVLSDDDLPAFGFDHDTNRFTGFGFDPTAERGAYFATQPILSEDGALIGVISVSDDLSDLAAGWSAVDEMLFVTDQDGIVVMSSNADWRFMATKPILQERLRELTEFQRFGEGFIRTMPIERSGAHEIEFMGGVYDQTSRPLAWLEGEMIIILALEKSRTLAVRTMIAFGALAFCLLGVLIALRSLSLDRKLTQSRRDASDLRDVNTKLTQAIVDRERAVQDLKSAQTELARKDRLAALGKFSSAVTHELGQPITAMRSYLAAAELMPPADAVRKTVPRLHDLVLRMQRITEDLRFFSRTPTNIRKALDLTEAVQKALELLEPNIQDHQVTISVGTEQQVTLLGDRLKIEQALVNIIRNGIDAMAVSQRRVLQISIGKTDGSAYVVVQDSGFGLGGTSIETLQEPFYTASRSGNGLGLGLSIASEIIREHDGSISAVDAEGGGARFEIRFPSNILT